MNPTRIAAALAIALVGAHAGACQSGTFRPEAPCAPTIYSLFPCGPEREAPPPPLPPAAAPTVQLSEEDQFNIRMAAKSADFLRRASTPTESGAERDGYRIGLLISWESGLSFVRMMGDLERQSRRAGLDRQPLPEAWRNRLRRGLGDYVDRVEIYYGVRVPRWIDGPLPTQIGTDVRGFAMLDKVFLAAAGPDQIDEEELMTQLLIGYKMQRENVMGPRDYHAAGRSYFSRYTGGLSEGRSLVEGDFFERARRKARQVLRRTASQS